MTALLAAVVLVGLLSAAVISVAAYRGFGLWLQFKRETAKATPADGLAERVDALEKKLAAAELQKLRRA